MQSFIQAEAARLHATERAGLQRRLVLPSGVDFSSNNYLGLAHSAALSERLAARLAADPSRGAAASRLLRGHLPAHEALEARLAAFKGMPAALLFPAGYMANVALLTTLIGPHDRVLSDAQNHASIIDGLRLSRCTKVVIEHNNLQAYSDALGTHHRSGRTFVVTESLFSMDGDMAPLPALADLCEQHGAALIVDDAHATGLYGPQHGGLVQAHGLNDRVLAVVSTFGKALGAGGACVAGPHVIIESLLNHARPFVFTTAMAPVLVHLIDAALDVLQTHPELPQQNHRNAATLRAALNHSGLLVAAPGPILPIHVGDNHRVMGVAAAIAAAGYDVRGIRPPTVAPGTARLRVCVHSNHTAAHLQGVAEAIAAAMEGA